MNRTHVHWRDGMNEAWRTITGNRMRSSLLILGVTIGVTTLLAIFTIVNGLSGRIRDDVVSSSRPYIYISRDSGVGGGDPAEKMRRTQLKPDLEDALARTEGVGMIDYEVSNNSGTVLKYEKEKTQFVQVFGCSQNFPFMFSIKSDEGRFFSASDVTARNRVAVLGYGPRKDLFPNRDPVGKTLRIYGKPYLVIGTMAERNHIIGQLGDNFVCVPWTTFEKDGLKQGFEDRNIALLVADGYETDEVISNITGTMRRERRLRAGQKNDFDIVASETYGELIDKVTQGDRGHRAGAGGSFIDRFAGRRDRGDEHHVDLGGRAHPRDRGAHGGRRAQAGRSAPGPGGGRDPDGHRRCPGHRPGLPGLLGHDPRLALPLCHFSVRDRGCGPVFHLHRHFLRSLSCQQGRPHGSHRGAGT